MALHSTAGVCGRKEVVFGDTNCFSFVASDVLVLSQFEDEKDDYEDPTGRTVRKGRKRRYGRENNER